jgi:NADP-dependent 3-hydroxy acid dehydrogenase YdfG
MLRLDGKIALVTGASSGIGEATAAAFAAAGARVVAAARRRERLEALRARLTEAHGPAACTPLPLDVRDRAAVRSAMRALEEKGLAEIDILLNNAGLAAGLDPIQEGRDDHWDRMLDTNVRGLLNVSREVLPGMIERRRGHVVNIGSISGHEVYPRGAVYCATKHAVRALDLHGAGVRVTSIDPGLLETEFSLVRFDGDAERAEAVYENVTPLSAEDVADAIVYAVTRPPHVNVEELVLMPTAQAAATMVHREP